MKNCRTLFELCMVREGARNGKTVKMQGMPTLSVRPKRVAAYARVSTNSEEQLTSYDAQVKHYTEHIKAREHSDNWQFVEVYTDKGITGSSTKKREGFNRMIQDALAGKIEIKTAELIQFDFSGAAKF